MILLLGKSGAGKDTLAERFVEEHPEYMRIVTYTTRPRRDYEVNGKDYRFVKRDVFEQLEKRGQMMAVSEYNNWKYGIFKPDLVDNSILIVTPEGMRDLKRAGYKCITIMLSVDDRSRMNMLLNRGDDVNEIVRRWPTDNARFEGVDKEVDFVINNENYCGDEDLLVTYIEESLKLASGEITMEDSELVERNQTDEGEVLA